MDEKLEPCLQDECLSYLMARKCRASLAAGDCSGFCGFSAACPFEREERDEMSDPDFPIQGLTEAWRRAIVSNRNRLYEAAKEEGRRETEERWKAKEEKWQTSE